MNSDEIRKKVAETLVNASSVFSEDKLAAYEKALEAETEPLAAWALDTIRDNALTARKDHSPLCDDTGIPHLLLEIGRNRILTGEGLLAIHEGVASGLALLPGRPMAIRGDDVERVSQSAGLYPESETVVPAPVQIIHSDDENRLRLTVLMQGGGPEIRAKTYRIFHRHSMDVVVEEILSWARESISQLGCTPCTIAVGIGRSHYEASAMMLQAMAEGNYEKQSAYEKRITDALNQTKVGSMGLGGKVSVLATFMKVGPQRASGVRIVCMRPCCCFEPRVSRADF
ncbi:MAG: fumarate hydratase [Eubacterium sp.]|nr:fumarate hydratase [Eubacterium sp.]